MGATDVVRISRTIDAPINFVYGWCTDFREDDNRITLSKSRRRILEKTKKRVIYVTRGGGKKSAGSASIVLLNPPDSWHLNSIGDNRDISGDYHLTRLSGRRTRQSIVFRIKRKSPYAPNKSEFLHHINSIWDKYVAALEDDYRRRRQ